MPQVPADNPILRIITLLLIIINGICVYVIAPRILIN